MPKKVLSVTFFRWLPLGITIVIFSGLVYGAVQQNYRQGANDPQVQIAQDLATAIVHGQPMDQIVPAQGTTELSDTLSPFVMIYSATSTLVGSSAVLDGKNPSVPTGVLDVAKAKGENRVTWQPKPGVREALVVKYFSGPQSGFIVAGRSLKEIEMRSGQVLLMSEIAGLVALVLTFIVMLLFMNQSMKPDIKEEISLDIKISDDEANKM